MTNTFRLSYSARKILHLKDKFGYIPIYRCYRNYRITTEVEQPTLKYYTRITYQKCPDAFGRK